ncbi:hypothetical protein LO80_05955 [Candidatus Francisella endociliophora]|uniref:Uncharacterized protein n=1 Tax=Candidatus Francisella endociliophora TaxID=653937 RepID=A0A097EPQ5_9GAMM|nr:hypothetical protein [Francisella sp. FSC1006]AIT09552.1 hypothetical protein LO80_05955 [Francisella sp. FSC1006]
MDFIVIALICLVGIVVIFLAFKFVNKKSDVLTEDKITITEAIQESENKEDFTSAVDNTELVLVEEPKSEALKVEVEVTKTIENLENIFNKEKHEIDKSFRVIDKSVNPKTISKRIGIIKEHLKNINESAELHRQNDIRIFDNFEKELQKIHDKVSQAEEKLISLENN